MQDNQENLKPLNNEIQHVNNQYATVQNDNLIKDPDNNE